jgi:hypothetical protein
MIKLALLSFSLLFSATLFAKEICDLSAFKWDCDLKAKVMPKKHYKNLVYCGDTLVAISNNSRNTLGEYNHANVNMVLTVNGEYVDSPCNKYPY